VVVAAVVGGVTIGLVGRASVQSTEVVAWLSRLGAPWLLTAFLFGAWVGTRRAGALAGGAALAIGTAVYYFFFHFVEHRIGLGYGVVVGSAWALVGLGIGGAFGYAGAAWRAPDRWARMTPFVAARRREWPAALALGMTFAVTAVVLEAYARAALRVVGWGGA
jgi:hypothetical protein